MVCLGWFGYESSIITLKWSNQLPLKKIPLVVSFFFCRIQPLSEALDDLYKEFNALKSHLGELTDKFTAIESFIDDLKINKEKEKANTPAPVTPVRRRLIKTRTSASSSS